MRRTVEVGMRACVLSAALQAVVMVQDHKTPMLLLLQDGKDFRLPGGHLKPGEGELEGLRRKLTTKLSPPVGTDPDVGPQEWEIGELLAVWWRPMFEPYQYPYLPVHCTKPKECRKLYLVQLPPRTKFAVPKTVKLVAVSFFDLYANSAQFGPIIASIPQLLSRYTIMHNDPVEYDEALSTLESTPTHDEKTDTAPEQ
eukprot:TRINITY_DN7413_c0_g1_i3.p1 TRINITY_DN7413_c0_g1~~TRINITY_DN7413_c0_g1_i3.p1  ORF type:complete len:198 (-),score=29.22 TRINITY_DN7413_c0_g1_i3:210-803(-)